MKKTLASLMIASMVVYAVPTILPLNSASAAVQVQQSTKIVAQSILVDGVTQKITSITVKGKMLYSAKEIAKHLKAKYMLDAKTKTYKLVTDEKTVTFKSNTKYIMANNKKVNLQSQITYLKGHMFIELAPVVTALGGDVLQDGKTIFIASKGLATGSFTNAQWVSGNQIMVTSEDEKSYLLNVQTKKVDREFSIVEMAVSPDGKKAIYSDENGFVFLLDLKTGKATQISADESFKAEFKWVANGLRVIFFQGDKNEIIASLSIADGKITKILDDKVEYKSDLVISADGSRILYTAAKQAETKYTDKDKTDVDTIITEGTEPQIYFLNTTVEKSVPVAITTSKDNKFFTSLLPNGYVLYLAEDPENEAKLPELRLYDGQKETTIVSTKQINSVKVSVKGNVYVSVTEENGTSSIYKYTVSTLKLGQAFNTSQEVTGFDVSADEKQVIVTVATDKGEKVLVYKNGKLEAVTKN